MSENPRNEPEQVSESKEINLEQAEKIAEAIESGLEEVKKSKDFVRSSDEHGVTYMFMEASEQRAEQQKDNSPDKWDKHSKLAVAVSGNGSQERYYFKLRRQDYFTYKEKAYPSERNPQTGGFEPETLETGSKDLTIQLFGTQQELLAELSCKDGVCTGKNSKLLEGKTKELLSGVLQKELDKRKIIEKTREEEKKLSEEVEE